MNKKTKKSMISWMITIIIMMFITTIILVKAISEEMKVSTMMSTKTSCLQGFAEIKCGGKSKLDYFNSTSYICIDGKVNPFQEIEYKICGARDGN